MASLSLFVLVNYNSRVLNLAHKSFGYYMLFVRTHRHPSFLGRAVARAPISGFFLLSACLSVTITSWEVGRLENGIKRSTAYQIQPGDRRNDIQWKTTFDGRGHTMQDDL